MNTTYRFTTTADETLVDHADHIYEEWRGYVNDLTDAPAYVNGDSSGLCCHTCQLIIIED
jgi:hypothetical protein